MIRRKHARWAAPILVAAVWAAAASPARSEEEPPKYGPPESHLYEIHYLDVPAQQLLAQQQCATLSPQDCRWKLAPGYIELTAPPELHERFAIQLEEKDVPPRTQVFQVYLLQAEDVKSGPDPDLPPDARRALDDLRKLLPFRAFHHLDSAYTRTSREAMFVFGGDDLYYARLEFQGDPASGKPLEIRFQLSTKTEPVHQILETSFSMEVGETVVVGTSRLNGGKNALVVLLSAVS